MIKFIKNLRKRINNNLPTLGEKFDSRNRKHQAFATSIIAYVFFLLFILYSNTISVPSFASDTSIDAEMFSLTVTPTSTVPIATLSASVGLKYSIASLSAKIAPGGVGVKVFDLTSTGAHYFELYTPTSSLGILFSPSSGNITPGSSIPIYIKAPPVQGPGIYNGIIYHSSDLYLGQESTGIPTKIILDSGSIDTDTDGFSNQLENYINTDPNYKCGINAYPPDFNNDKLVRIQDINAIVKKYGTTDRRYDLDRDGKVTVADINIEKSYYYKDCQ